MLELLEAIFDEVKPMLGEGKVADYIPALASVDPHQFGIAICDICLLYTSPSPRD